LASAPICCRAVGWTQAQVIAAEILHYQNIVASSRANNNSADIVAALTVLRDLRAALTQLPSYRRVLFAEMPRAEF
jgi:hypothetical protein